MEDRALKDRTPSPMDPRWISCLEEIAEAAQELPAENQSERLRAALGSFVRFLPPPEALVGPPDPYEIGRSLT